MILKNKFSGYSKDGLRTYNLNGGGGGGTTQTTSYQTNIPEYARPYVENMLGATQQQLFKGDKTADGGFNITGFQPYRAYGGTYDEQGNQTSYDPGKSVAGFSPLEQQAQRGIAGLQMPGEYDAATMGTIGSMGGWNTGAANQYMSPYIEAAMAPQIREAMRTSAMQGMQQQSEAVGRGAFGGSRDALMRAERERNLNMGLGDIRARGYQTAYEQGANQFNQDMARRLQGAGQLASIGGQRLNAEQGIYNAQASMGAQQRQLEQQKINQAIQDYANAQQYPLLQLGTMSNMLRGLPMQAQTTQMYATPPSPLTQAIGTIGAGAMLYGATNPTGRAQGGIVGYDAGGEVRSDLEQMETDALKRYARESESESIKRMAQQILRDRIPGPGMAGGGIIAFQEGSRGTVGDDAAEQEKLTPLQRSARRWMEKRRENAISENLSEELRSRYGKKAGVEGLFQPQSDVERADAQRIMATSPDMSVGGKRALLSATKGPLELISGDRDYGGEQRISSLAGQNISRDDLEVGRAMASRAPANRPGTSKPTQIDDLITQLQAEQNQQEAPPNAPPRQGTPGGVNSVAGPSRPTAPPPAAVAATPLAADQGTTDATPQIDKYASEIVTPAQTRADKPLAEFIAENERARRAAGIKDFEGTSEYRSRVMAERASTIEEADRKQKLRLAEFFAKWGSTPGGVLVAGMSALKDTLPTIIQDEEALKKARQDSDKIIYELDRADALERSGHVKEAQALKAKAGEEARAFNAELAKMRASAEENRAKIRSAEKIAQERERGETTRTEMRIRGDMERTELTERGQTLRAEASDATNRLSILERAIAAKMADLRATNDDAYKAVNTSLGNVTNAIAKLNQVYASEPYRKAADVIRGFSYSSAPLTDAQKKTVAEAKATMDSLEASAKSDLRRAEQLNDALMQRVGLALPKTASGMTPGGSKFTPVE